jgi:CDP-paratose synthetase
MRILITGATGFVGEQVAKALQQNNHQLILLVRAVAKISFSGFSGSYTPQIIDLNLSTWKQEITHANPDAVLHLAAYLTSADDEQSIDKLISSNLSFGMHLLNALQTTQLKYFINTGTFAEYRDNNGIPNPSYLYAATKTAFRSILSYYSSITGFKVVNVIPYTIYGAVDTKKKLIDYIYDSITASSPIKMSPGEQILDFIHIEDVVSFYLHLFNNLSALNHDFTEIHLGTGVGTTPKQIAAIIENITGEKTNIDWGGIPYRPRDTMYSVADIKPFVQITNWEPYIRVREGLVKYIQLMDL